MAKKWYVVHTYSGYEEKSKKALEERIKQHQMEHLFGEILVPSEDVVEVKKGTKRKSKRQFFPGYILVNVDLNETTWRLVKDTPKVTGFVGGSLNPATVSKRRNVGYGKFEAKIARFLNRFFLTRMNPNGLIPMHIVTRGNRAIRLGVRFYPRRYLQRRIIQNIFTKRSLLTDSERQSVRNRFGPSNRNIEALGLVSFPEALREKYSVKN